MNKMPDLGWDIAETQLQSHSNPEKPQEPSEPKTTSIPVPLQTIITIVILIATMLQYTRSYMQGIARKAMHAVKSTTTKINRSNFTQDIRKTYKDAVLAITIATRMTDHTNRTKQHKTTNRNPENFPGT